MILSIYPFSFELEYTGVANIMLRYVRYICNRIFELDRLLHCGSIICCNMDIDYTSTNYVVHATLARTLNDKKTK